MKTSHRTSGHNLLVQISQCSSAETRAIAMRKQHASVLCLLHAKKTSVTTQPKATVAGEYPAINEQRAHKGKMYVPHEHGAALFPDSIPVVDADPEPDVRVTIDPSIADLPTYQKVVDEFYAIAHPGSR